MKKILIWSLILVLAAVVSVVGTIAYFTAVDEEVNVMVVDDARIEIVEYERVNTNDKNTNAVVKEFRDNKPLIPSVVQGSSVYSSLDNNAYASFSVDNAGKTLKACYTYPIWNPDNIAHEIDKMVFVKNTGDCNVYVRLCFAFEAGNYVRIDRFKEMVHMNLNGDENQWVWSWNDKLAEVDGTRCFIAWATYQKPVAPGELTDISLAQIALDYTAINDHARAFGDTYDVKVFAQGIQSDGFATASAALSNGFDDTIPFKNVKFLEFTDLKDAIYKAGDLNTVTFGLTSEHPDVVKSYNGILVANIAGQADFTAYAYHVPVANGLYDVYVLADNWKIYTPNDSGALFKDRANLTKVDTSNLNVSETTKMNEMFCNCPLISDLDVSEWDVSKVTSFNNFLSCAIDSDGNGTIDIYNDKLTSLDVSGWNTKSATDMSYMFYGCRALASLDVSGWNVGNVTSFEYLFALCKSLTSIEVEDWDTSKAINMNYMFCECVLLTELDLSGWNVSTVKQTGAMFEKCLALKKLNVSTWDVRNVYEMGVMFRRCEVLEELDLRGWETDSLLRTNHMFENCYKLEKILFDDDWYMSGTIKTQNMFNNCKALTSLNVSGWDVSSVVDMNHMFSGCTSLTTLEVSNWKTPKVENMGYMFSGCSALTTLNVLGWSTDNVKNMGYMFNGCSSLSSLDVSDWNTAKVESMESMFKDCVGLTKLDASGWSTDNVTNMESMFRGCKTLSSLDVSNWNTAKVESMEFMFRDCVGLTKLDLSSWNTGKVNDCERMFDNCLNLVTISVGDGWNMSQVVEVPENKAEKQEKLSSTNMFNNCKLLKGGNGTTYDKNKTNKEYAHIDGGPSDPGYLTKKSA